MRIDPSDVAICIDDGGPDDGQPAPMAAPIVQTSLFAFPDFQALLDGLDAEHENAVYSRGSNPIVELLEHKLARLEHGEACRCFGSGMAAVSAVLLGLLRAGDHVLFVNHIYGPTLQLAHELSRFGVDHDLVLDTDADAVRAAIRPQTRIVWMESPGTMMFRTLDIRAIATVAHEHGAIACVDNSWATPLFQKPIDSGADIVVHSATKYIGGHSDVIGGAVITTAGRMLRIFRRAYMLNGGVLAPFDAWLLLRGMRTLPARMRQHDADGRAVAGFLRTHDRVTRVFHPAFEPTSPGVSATDGSGGSPTSLRGCAGVFSFELADAGFDEVRRFIDALEIFRIGVSWGGVESLVISPNRGTNGEALDAQRVPRGLVRLSVGLEGAETLIADLAAALDIA